MRSLGIPIDLYLAHVRDAVALFDIDRRLVHVSPRFEILFGVDKVEAIGMEVAALFDQTPILLEKIIQVFESHERVYIHEITVTTDVVTAVNDVDIFTLMDLDDAWYGVAVCLSSAQEDSVFIEQKKRQDALGRLGQLASGLAHEIKNPLSGIKGAAQLLLSETKDNDRLVEYADIVVSESERVDRLVRELLDFTKPRELRLKKTNINQILHQVVLMQQVATTKRVRWIEDFDPSLPEITLDEDAIKQVLLNLVQNAIDAVTDDAQIRLTSNVVTDVLLRTGDVKRQIVRIAVADNGSGMDEEILKDVFTPYFSTKAQGTGLGLAVVNRLVELHGGSVGVKSSKQRGTEFSIYLPV